MRAAVCGAGDRRRRAADPACPVAGHTHRRTNPHPRTRAHSRSQPAAATATMLARRSGKFPAGLGRGLQCTQVSASRTRRASSGKAQRTRPGSTAPEGRGGGGEGGWGWGRSLKAGDAELTPLPLGPDLQTTAVDFLASPDISASPSWPGPGGARLISGPACLRREGGGVSLVCSQARSARSPPRLSEPTGATPGRRRRPGCAETSTLALGRESTRIDPSLHPSAGAHLSDPAGEARRARAKRGWGGECRRSLARSLALTRFPLLSGVAPPRGAGAWASPA